MERSRNLTIQIRYLLIRTVHSTLCAEMRDWLGITTTEAVKLPAAMGTIPTAVAMAREKVMETIRTNQKTNEEKTDPNSGDYVMLPRKKLLDRCHQLIAFVTKQY